MNLHSIITNPFYQNVWIISDETDNSAVLVDPGAEPEKILSFIKINELNPLAILCTHAHPDHISAISAIQKSFPVPCYIHQDDRQTLETSTILGQMLGFGEFDLPNNLEWIDREKTLTFGKLEFQVIHTPGHTPGSVCFQIGDSLLSGDTLFAGSVGRINLPGGSWKLLKESLEKLSALPESLTVYPGHGRQTTIREELRSNPYLKRKSVPA